MKELFPEVEKIEPPPKVLQKRKRLHNFSDKQNRSRYYRHRKIRDLDLPVLLQPKALKMECSLGFDITDHKHVKILIEKFGYALEAKPFVNIKIHKNET